MEVYTKMNLKCFPEPENGYIFGNVTPGFGT
jgi:hypothetical protein